jgi:drug/metabolite transporter (DMT)-like permease
MWLVVALTGFVIAAVVNILDKFVLDKTIKNPVVFVFYSTIFALLFFLAVPWAGNLAGGFDYVIALLCAICFVISLWTGYVAIQKSEISHIGPFIGAVLPIFTFIWSKIFFNEQFSSTQIIAIVLLVFGSFVISFEKSAKHNGLHEGIVWGVVTGLFWSIFSVSAKYLYGHNDFAAGFVWSQAAIGAVTLMLLFLPAVRQSFRRTSVPAEKMTGNKIALVAVDKFLGFVAVFLIQFAVSLGSVTLIYALAGVQYIILIIAVALLSKFYSRFYREEYSRGELVQEFLAVILIAAGIFLLV